MNGICRKYSCCQIIITMSVSIFDELCYLISNVNNQFHGSLSTRGSVKMFEKATDKVFEDFLLYRKDKELEISREMKVLFLRTIFFDFQCAWEKWISEYFVCTTKTFLYITLKNFIHYFLQSLAVHRAIHIKIWKVLETLTIQWSSQQYNNYYF